MTNSVVYVIYYVFHRYQIQNRDTHTDIVDWNEPKCRKFFVTGDNRVCDSTEIPQNSDGGARR